MSMSCDDARDLLTDRIMDDLDSGDRARLEEHLESCADCHAAAIELSAAWEALGELPAPALDPDAAIRFGRRLEARRSGPRFRLPLQMAAAVALLLAGGVIGRAMAPGDPGGPADDSPRFLLLLRGTAPDEAHPRDRLVREYGAWAGTLAEGGALVAAEELDPESGRWVGPGDASDRASAPVGGYFVIRAPSYDSATAIARDSPHAAYGGVVEVRRIAEPR